MFLKNNRKILYLIALCFILSLFNTKNVYAKENEAVFGNEITITFVGDCTLGTYLGQSPGNRFDEVYNENGSKYFFSNVYSIFNNDDITLVNLEGPLTSEKQTAIKKFPIKGEINYVDILKNGSIEMCSLANNHILDCGEKGLIETKKILKDNYIGYAINDDIGYIDIDGCKVAFLSFKGWDFSNELKNNIKNNINKAKENNAKLIIVSFHWGEERVYSHNKTQEQIAHFAIDSGADFIVGTHSHCLQGIEEYNGKTILYSLGNFCFGANKNPADKDTIIYQQKFDVFNNKVTYLDTTVYPCKISSVNTKNDYRPTISKNNDAERILDKFYNKCK